MLLRKYISTGQLLQRFRETHRKTLTLEGRERTSETLTDRQEDVTETPEKDKRLGRSTASGVLSSCETLAIKSVRRVSTLPSSSAILLKQSIISLKVLLHHYNNHEIPFQYNLSY